MSNFESWLWPNRTIGKRESARLRKEHNMLLNSHNRLLAACKAAHQLAETGELEGWNPDEARAAVTLSLERAIDGVWRDAMAAKI